MLTHRIPFGLGLLAFECLQQGELSFPIKL
jgi:hypothetical protein